MLSAGIIQGKVVVMKILNVSDCMFLSVFIDSSFWQELYIENYYAV